MNYASRKQKADASSIDEYNLLKDYALFSDRKTYLDESYETYLWSNEGDVLKKDELDKITDTNNGVFWRGFLSFPSDFAISHGFITKADYYSLSNQVIPELILDMGLNLNNVSWYCSLHRDTSKHPHIHFCIFEKIPTKSNPTVPRYCFKNFKSNVANYLIDNQKFYELRDKSFSDITEKINLQELNKIKNQRLFSDKYRKDLNKLLLKLYDELPLTGRLQYNSKNMNLYRKDIDAIIDFVLSHDSVKYDYANYLKLLDKHQKELDAVYGNSKSNQERKYYNDQRNKLYSRIGNEILDNFKRYQSLNRLEREKEFLHKNIIDMNFKSRKDYHKEDTKKNIAKDLYKVCILADLNNQQIKKTFRKWLHNSHYSFDVNSLISSVRSLDTDMSIQELYSILKKLGYDYDRYSKFKNDNFYKELNYKRFIQKAIEHLYNELEQEEKKIINQMEYELEVGR